MASPEVAGTEDISDEHRNQYLILRAREYQNELVEKALRQNSIVFLGTGAGKTFIATMVIKELGNALRDGSNKKTVFLVPSVALVSQQERFLSINTPFTVKSFCGADGVDGWNDTEWAKRLSEPQVLVMVHQVFLDALRQGFLSLDRVNLLVFDECHHAMQKHPYKQIMDKYHDIKVIGGSARLPRILGLSASVVAKKCDRFKFVQEKTQLEKNLDARVITTEDLASISKYVTAPSERFQDFSSRVYGFTFPTELLTRTADNGLEALENCKLEAMASAQRIPGADKIVVAQKQKKIKDQHQKVERLLSNMFMTLNDLGFCAANEILAAVEEDLQSKSLLSDDAFDSALKLIASRTMNDARQVVESTLEATPPALSNFERLMYFSSQKLETLFNIIAEENREQCRRLNDNGKVRRLMNSQMSAVIFVQTRLSAAIVSHILQRVGESNQEFAFLKVGHVVGHHSSPETWSKGKYIADQETVEARKKLDKTLYKFRSGALNCLVATQVLEEGMDVKQCNLVVRFDKIQTLRSYIQGKGRARAKPSSFVIMEDRSNPSYPEIMGYRQIENDAINLCYETVENIGGDDSSENEVYLSDPSNPSSPWVDSFNAIGLVHRYVQSLPTDRFTDLAPYFEFESRDRPQAQADLFRGLGFDVDPVAYGRFHCVLHLPHLTPIKEPIVGNWALTRKDAKRKAALLACKKLHQLGELDYHLKPKNRRVALDDDDDEDDPGGPKVGTRRSKAYYETTLPEPFRSLGSPAAKRPAHLYEISLALDEPVVEAAWSKKQYEIYRPEDHSTKLGLLLGSEVPSAALASFHLYTVSGRLLVRLKHYGICRPLSPDQTSAAVKFSQLAFGADGLCLTPPWMNAVAPSEDAPDYMMVPVNTDRREIDFDLLDNLTSVNPVSKFEGDPLTGLAGAVVVSTYHNNEPYVVEEVVTDLRASSPMPNNNSVTFVDHYAKKGIRIENPDQPLLRISHGWVRHDMVKPVVRGREEGLESGRPQSREDFLRRRMLLLPELVLQHRIPGPVWRELQVFPFVVHRLQKIIRASELAGQVNAGISMNLKETTCLPDEPLNFEFHAGINLFKKLLTFHSPKECSPPTGEDLIRPLTMLGAGETFDLEREEILGDSFLKYITSVKLYLTEGSLIDEGSLTQMRSKIVGNKKLFRSALANNLVPCVTHEKFEPHRNWRPPLFQSQRNIEETLSDWDTRHRKDYPKTSKTLFQTLKADDVVELLKHGDLDNESRGFVERVTAREVDSVEQKQVEQKSSNKGRIGNHLPRERRLISDKSMADVVEALIGCYLVKCGQEKAAHFLSWLDSDATGTQKGDIVGSLDWFIAPPTAILQHAGANACCRQSSLGKIDVPQVETILGYYFREKSFLLEALTHCSYRQNKETNSLERLEFLGDAVIDYLVTCHLFTAYGNKSPGAITNLRSSLVNNNALGRVCVTSGLHRHLLHAEPKLMSKINEYLNYLSEENSEGEAIDAGFKAGRFIENLDLINEDDCPVLVDVEVPKALGDVVESVMGAVYVDSGFSLLAVWKAFGRLFPIMDEVARKNPRSPVARLMERFPESTEFKKLETTARGKANVKVLVTVDPHDPDSVLSFRGLGSRQKNAKDAAARCAIRALTKAGRF